MNCAFDDGAFDSVAFDTCVPAPASSSSSFQVGGGNYDPYYWDRIRKIREEEEIIILM